MAILDRPIEELKKPMGQPVDFGAVMNDILRYNPKKKRSDYLIFACDLLIFFLKIICLTSLSIV